MSWAKDATKGLDIAGMALHALEAIGPIAQGILGDEKTVLSSSSMAKIASISLAVDAIRKGLEGTLPLESVQDEITHLASSHQANIDATASELEEKFPKSK